MALERREVLRIAATSDSLCVKLGRRYHAPLALLELKAFEEFTPNSAGQEIWRGVPSSSSFAVSRFEGPRDRLYSKFQLVDAATRRPIGTPHYVDDLSRVGARSFDFPWPKSIKGLQVQEVEDAIALGVKHGGLNLLVSQVVDWSGKSAETWPVDGERIPINSDFVKQFDAQVKKLTDAGINVTVILLNGVPTQPDSKNPFIHPKTDLANVPYHLGAFNTTDERGLRYYRAVVEYLANRYSQPGSPYGWVSGYIIGNEVQAHWEWYNIGRVTLDDFVKDYGIALRVADLAVRRFHSKIRVYVSMEHHWDAAIREDPLTAFPGREFVERLSEWSKSEGDFPWHVAF
ncbi:MAG: hypothetical protein HY318_00545, partial [Armatimonadetes bacterium]|nr:hypothetical protein [Armatimonadota bacterium]